MRRTAWAQIWRCRSREGAVALALLLVFGAAQAATMRPWAFGERVLSVDCADVHGGTIVPRQHPRHVRPPAPRVKAQVVRVAPRPCRPIEGRPAPRAPDPAA